MKYVCCQKLSKIALSVAAAWLVTSCQLPQEQLNAPTGDASNPTVLDAMKDGIDVMPNRGSVNGGEFIHILGGGGAFSEDVKISLGGTPCVSLKRIKSSEVICETPSHTSGAVDLKIESNGLTGLVKRAFTYYPETAWIGMAIQRTQGWELSKTPYASTKYGVAVDRNYVYATTCWGGVIERFERETGKYFGPIGPELREGSSLINVRGVAADDKGFIYVTDARRGGVYKFVAETAWFVGWVGKIGYARSSYGVPIQCPAGPAVVGQSTPGWCFGGSPSMVATDSKSDAGMYQPEGIVYHDGILYVADQGNYPNVKRFDAESGAFLGTIPTPEAYNGYTSGLYTDGVYLYRTASLKVVRYDLKTGAFAGWIGKIVSPRTYTPSYVSNWNMTPLTNQSVQGYYAMGGASETDPGFSNSLGITGDWFGRLLISDQSWVTIIDKETGNYLGRFPRSPMATYNYTYHMALGADGYLYAGAEDRLERFDSGGVFRGYLGVSQFPKMNWKVNHDYTNGGDCSKMKDFDASCGEAIMAKDTKGNLYVSNGFGIMRISSAGESTGWIGTIDPKYPPRGGADGCNGAAGYTFTPGWCKGGRPISTPGENSRGYPDTNGLPGFYGISAMKIVDDILYVSEYTNIRVSRFDLKTGRSLGWIGLIYKAGLTGSPACEAAAPGTLTPGWCLGGFPKSMVDPNLFGYISAMTVSKGKVYVTETRTSRVGNVNKIFVGLHAFDAKTGARLWVKDQSAPLFRFPPSMIADQNGTLYVTAQGLKLVRFDGETGELLGSTSTMLTSAVGGQYTRIADYIAIDSNGVAYGVFTNAKGDMKWLGKFSPVDGKELGTVDLMGDVLTGSTSVLLDEQEGFMYVNDVRRTLRLPFAAK